VTEDQWLKSVRPLAMLRFLRGRASDRKLRLFASACWHRLQHLLADGRLRWLLGLLDPRADGRVSAEELQAARNAAWAALQGRGAPASREQLAALRLTAWGFPPRATTAAHWAARTGREVAAYVGDWAVAAERKTQCDLLRDLFGNPFRPAALDPAVLDWGGGVVRRVAQAIYDERRFEDLPVLADALEDAGCADGRILAHCREAGGHVRGCWVVDLVRSVD
jgi:hypothetical protein